jgi:phage gpG-like protein
MAKINKIPDFEAMGEAILKDAESYAAVTGLNFFKESFEKQGFTDTAFESWQQRKNDLRQGGAILVDTGQLRDSLQILERGNNRIKFGTFSPYAGIHNNGGLITISLTEKSRKFFWYMYYQNTDKTGTITSDGSATAASMWKALALTKKDKITIKMPKRQFIGESQTLLNNLDEWILNRIVERFKSL